MTHRSHQFPGSVHFFDQMNGVGVVGQVPQRTMASGVIHRIKVRGGNGRQLGCIGERVLRLPVLPETEDGLYLYVRLVTAGIDRGAAALRRSKRNTGGCILENVVGRSEFTVRFSGQYRQAGRAMSLR